MKETLKIARAKFTLEPIIEETTMTEGDTVLSVTGHAWVVVDPDVKSIGHKNVSDQTTSLPDEADIVVAKTETVENSTVCFVESRTPDVKAAMCERAVHGATVQLPYKQADDDRASVDATNVLQLDVKPNLGWVGDIVLIKGGSTVKMSPPSTPWEQRISRVGSTVVITYQTLARDSSADKNSVCGSSTDIIGWNDTSLDDDLLVIDTNPAEEKRRASIRVRI